MAFDGSAICALKQEFNTKLVGGHISKIIQPGRDELIITVKSSMGQFMLLLSADPSLPAAYITEEKKTAPLQAPTFCMLLRKHLQGGLIISVTQPSMERILDFEIEHYNEMGDLCRKTLTIELMGKHSNIIFRDGTKILDSIRHVSAFMSSVREVLPGREYFIPFAEDKLDPFIFVQDSEGQNACRAAEISGGCYANSELMSGGSYANSEVMSGGNHANSEAVSGFGEMGAHAPGCADIFAVSEPLYKSLYMHITGFSPELAEEIAFMAGIDGGRPAGSLSAEERALVVDSIASVMQRISDGNFAPCIICKDGMPVAFAPFPFKIHEGLTLKMIDSMSALLYEFYSSRQAYTQIRQRTSDLRQIAQSLLAKDVKKLDLQSKQLKDTEKKDKYKVYGELLTAYGYSVSPAATSFTTENFYTGEKITIPLDPTLTAIENGKKYFERYSKLRRTAESLGTIIVDTQAEIDHLSSILVSLECVTCAADISDIRREMTEAGYIRTKAVGRGASSKGKKPEKAQGSAPAHYVSSDGFDIYVGKNNFQNEFVTFKLADSSDWWFHAKKIPGSHVVIKCDGREPSDRTFEEAASLAAHFSQAREAGKAEVDYVRRRAIKKPAGAKPGFVIYHTNYSMSAGTDISGISQV